MRQIPPPACQPETTRTGPLHPRPAISSLCGCFFVHGFLASSTYPCRPLAACHIAISTSRARLAPVANQATASISPRSRISRKSRNIAGSSDCHNSSSARFFTAMRALLLDVRKTCRELHVLFCSRKQPRSYVPRFADADGRRPITPLPARRQPPPRRGQSLKPEIIGGRAMPRPPRRPQPEAPLQKNLSPTKFSLR